jgi:DSF synthase
MNKIQYANEISFRNFRHLEVCIDPEESTVWIYLNAYPRPCITRTLLNELKIFQSQLVHYGGKLSYRGELIDINYHVVSSRHPVFSFGGDLDYFLECIDTKDVEALRNYGRACIDTMYPNLKGFDLGITTISLIHGHALGGGLEAAMSSHVIIAERKAEMGLPEVLFNLFPGMGAYNLLAQRLNPAMAEKIILGGRLYKAEEFYDMGVVDILAEDGRGEDAVYSFIRTHRKQKNSYEAIRKIRQLVNPVLYQQLLDICDIWADAALKLTEKDLRTMKRLVRSQERFAVKESRQSMSQATAY